MRQIKLNVTLKGKSGKIWLKGKVFTDPLPSDIEFEFEQNRPGNLTEVLTAETVSSIGDAPHIVAGTIDFNQDQEFISLEQDREILFRQFEKSLLNKWCVEREVPEYQSSNWFHGERGAKEKRKLLLRKF